MTTRFLLLCGVLCLLITGLGPAYLLASDDTAEADGRPGEYFFLKGVEAFRKQQYKFAVEMYEVASAWAFKPAQFNLAIMHARGQGLPQDVPRGMAWMMLAAERGEPRYLEARDLIDSQLTKHQADRANALWQELKGKYGDEVALRRARVRWAEARAHRTGSRVGSAAGPLILGIPGQTPGEPRGLSGGPRTPPIEGSAAYRKLLESNEPYDPRFERRATGSETVATAPAVETGPQRKRDEVH